jgi:deoxyribonuclease-4
MAPARAVVYRSRPVILGAHEGVSGGVSTAFARAEADGADCVQIFTRSSRMWAAKPLDLAEIERFRAEARRTGLPVAAHSTYLINLCCDGAEIRQKSWDALADELARCEQLGVRWLVFHPGSHADADAGVALAAEGMTSALERVPGESRLLLETTAGQGASIGWRFEQLAAIRERIPARLRRRVGVCLDSCHVFAAGYDLATAEGYERTFAELDDHVGLEHLEAFHLNDSKKGLGCRVDRHEHIGRGALGLEPFRRLVNDARFVAHPAFLETELEFRENLAVLRSLHQ